MRPKHQSAYFFLRNDELLMTKKAKLMLGKKADVREAKNNSGAQKPVGSVIFPLLTLL